MSFRSPLPKPRPVPAKLTAKKAAPKKGAPKPGFPQGKAPCSQAR